ncbi:MAG: ribonuclease E [Phycisphaerales bacterium]|jgi:ribonuclease E
MTNETDTPSAPSTPSDDLNSISSQTSPGAGSPDGSGAGDDAAPTSKKTSKRTTKKTTKKPAAKKTTKKVAKKPAAKKTTKKVVKKAAAKKTAKKTTKKTSAKPADEQSETDTGADAEPVETTRVEAVETAESEPSKPAAKKTAKRSSKRAPRRAPSAGDALESGDLAASEQADAEMIVNYVPGEECRIAIVEDGQLEEFYSEPTGSVSRVGNIYVGRVTNVESSIQAAFVDFGLPENGFLHSSDIHPRYFPSGSDTEQVGKKTPRRERPPIQQCLKKGQEIIVQVLKEGVGTKGPSLTSYLSVPGRYLVMMPDMDSLGVSRKEDDEEKRREAKRILSQLDIPSGFGFILRTAGFGRTKAELKRDLAYLQRLWLDMEKRRRKGNKPRLLYSESDLLLRSMRDLVGAHITRVVIDDPSALERAARFLKIVSPRSQAKLASYDGARPVFYAFGIEDQIKMIHSREVPLRSGGRLIIDQTEALVAIDVNSGKSRGAKDAETNAYKTNLEAVDVICRQLRLRDLGGLVISDLIDMRHLRHRQAIEQRFLERLKTDRAKSTILPISQFGILEMTRQRMRGSQESLNFADCQTCKGRGLVQRPDSVTAEALRQLADILQHDKVDRAELVVHSKIAGSLLTTRRASLTRVELRSGKKVDVRVSETHALDRVTIYAYDASGNDLDADRFRATKQAPQVTPYDPGEIPDDGDDGFAADLKSEAAAQSTSALAEQLLHVSKAETDDSLMEIAEGDLPPEGDGQGEGGKKKRRRRRGGRGRRKEGEEQDQGENAGRDDSGSRQSDNQSDSSDSQSEPTYANPKAEDGTDGSEGDESRDGEARDGEAREGDASGEGGKKKRRRRRRGGRGRRAEGENAEGEQTEGQRAQGEQGDSDSHESNNASVLEPTAAEPVGTGPKAPRAVASDDHAEENTEDRGDAPRKKRSRRGGRNRSGSKGEGSSGESSPSREGSSSSESSSAAKPKPTAKPKPSSSAEPKAAAAPVKKKRRTLYSSTRRKLSGAEAERPKD